MSLKIEIEFLREETEGCLGCEVRFDLVNVGDKRASSSDNFLKLSPISLRNTEAIIVNFSHFKIKHDKTTLLLLINNDHCLKIKRRQSTFVAS